jgi:uncharacterized membrane protein YphA (DoxX/SURF4 family)
MASFLKRWLTSPVVALLFRLALGAVFVYAGLVKGSDPQGFGQSIYNYQILPGWVITPMAILLPWVEVLVGASLLLGVLLRGGSLMASGLLAVFVIALIFNLARGLDIACGCFSTGSNEGAGTSIYLLRDLTLLAMGIHVFLLDQGLASFSRLAGRGRER